MNKFQKLYCAISGFERYECWSSASDDFYYDLINKHASLKDILNYLQSYALEYVEEMTTIECSKVHELLIKKFEGIDDRNLDFDNLA